MQHKVFKDITSYFKKGDLLVLNNTSVIPARIYGKKESGGNVEIMLERIMENNKALVQINLVEVQGLVLVYLLINIRCNVLIEKIIFLLSSLNNLLLVFSIQLDMCHYLLTSRDLMKIWTKKGMQPSMKIRVCKIQCGSNCWTSFRSRTLK